MVKGDSPGAGDPHRHLSTLDGWREFTSLAAGLPDLLAEAGYEALGSAPGPPTTRSGWTTTPASAWWEPRCCGRSSPPAGG